VACCLNRFSETKTMKNKKTNYFIFLVSFFSIFNLYGQEFLQKGSSVLGGGIGAMRNNSSTEEPIDSLQQSGKVSSFQISPYFGRFIKDNLVLGVKLNFGTSKNESSFEDFNQTSNTEQKGRSYGAGIFLRKYFPVLEKFGVFIQPEINYNFYSSDNVRYSSFHQGETVREDYEDRESRSFSVNTSLGLYYFISPRFSIETSLGTLGLTKSKTNKEETNNYNDDSRTTETNSDSFSINFINELTFDKIFVINYFF
jgi:hypothetical protein